MKTHTNIAVTFPNYKGENLSARIDMPAGREPMAWAIFAHCFTCGKNLKVARNISSALTSEGIAVFSFDFTGLGNSEGDFSQTNFSSNVKDLVAAANFLEKEYERASILIGHSLGGAAVLQAGEKIKSIQAVCTIGAPYEPGHVTKLFDGKEDEIREKGKAEVQIGPTKIMISKEFLEDIQENKVTEVLEKLRIPVLILHSPQDEIVGIENARLIYKKLYHPKSFISLDGADHLISNSQDSIYISKVISAWASRYVDFKEHEIHTDQQVVTATGKDGYTTQIRAGEHYLISDEPKDVGGKDLGPSPYGYLLSALGACTGMTLRMYADRKKWDLKEVQVHLHHEKIHLKDSEKSEKIDKIERQIELEGDLSEEQKSRLLEIAEKCPVHKTLHQEVQVETELKN